MKKNERKREDIYTFFTIKAVIGESYMTFFSVTLYGPYNIRKSSRAT